MMIGVEVREREVAAEAQLGSVTEAEYGSGSHWRGIEIGSVTSIADERFCLMGMGWELVLHKSCNCLRIHSDHLGMASRGIS